MTSVGTRIRSTRRWEAVVPLPTNGKEMGLALHWATQEFQKAYPGHTIYDDTFLIEADEEEIVVSFALENTTAPDISEQPSAREVLVARNDEEEKR